MSETVAARWEEYNEAGRRSFGLGQFAEAEELFRAAVREGEQLGSDSPHLATSLNALGQLRLQAKDLVEAERCFTRALAIREQTYGPDSHAIVPSLNNLSALHDAKGETDKAVDLLRRSLLISDQALGGSHPEVAITLNNLAKLYFKRRDFAKADRLLLKLLETKRTLGKDHPEVATVLGSLAKLRQAVGKHGPAEGLWRQALAIRERAFAPNDVILATTVENVADCCAAQEGRLADAIALRERALGIREVAMGAGHASLAPARVKLEELRARPGAPRVQPMESAGPPRNSQEVPSPIFSHEVPPYSSAQGSAPSPDLPWIQMDAEPTGERPPPRLELMGMQPPMAPGRRPDADAELHRSPLVPPPIPMLAPRKSNELVFTDSLAPEATPPAPRHPARPVHSAPAHSGHAHAAPPPRANRTPRSGTTAHRQPARGPSLPSKKRRSKAPILFAIVVVMGASGAWYTVTGRTAAAAALLEPVISRVERSATRVASQTPTAVPATPPSGTTRTDAAGAGPRKAVAARPRPATTEQPRSVPVAAVAKKLPVRDSIAKTQPAEDSASTLDVELTAPQMPESATLDSITRGIEQATRSKVDSAQKARLEIKTPPIFRKP